MEFTYGLFNVDASGRDCNAFRCPLQKPIAARPVGQNFPNLIEFPKYNCQIHEGPVLSQSYPTTFLLLQVFTRFDSTDTQYRKFYCRPIV